MRVDTDSCKPGSSSLIGEGDECLTRNITMTAREKVNKETSPHSSELIIRIHCATECKQCYRCTLSAMLLTSWTE